MIPVVLVAAAVACGAVRKPPEPNRRLDLKMSGALFEIERGYRFAALPEPGAKVLRLDVRYPVGSADDPPGKAGLAHLVEHLLFEAELTRSDGKTSISAELGRLALSWNAETHFDYTTYQVLAEPKALDELIQLEVERVHNGCGGITPAIFAREREVVLNELRQNMGASGSETQRLIHQEVFPVGHAYRHVDSIDTVAKLDLKDVCDFVATAYHRGKAFIIVSGAVTGPDLQAAASRHFGRLKNRDLSPRPIPPMVAPRPGAIRIKADVDEPTLIVTWPLPRMASAEYRLLELGWYAIAPRLASFGLEYGWGHTPYTTILGGAHAPVLAVSITLTSASKLDEAVDAATKSAEYAFRELYRGGDDTTTGNWREHWQASAESLLARWESLAGRNELFGDFLQFDTSEGFLVGRIDELTKSHPAEARRQAEAWLTPSRARYLMLEPSGTPGTYGRRTYTGGGEAHGTRVDGAVADLPLAVPTTNLALATERYRMDNGLAVVLWPHGEAPLVHGRLVIDSGEAHDPVGKEGVAWLVGADAVDSDSLVFDRRNLATRVDEVVAGLALELRSPGYELGDKFKDYLLGRLKLRRAKERSTYDLEFRTALYGTGHPYARASITETSLGEISRDVVMDWARGHMVPKNATLILAGKFDAALIKQHVAYNADQVSSGGDSPDRNVVAHTTPRFLAGTTKSASLSVELAVRFVAGTGIDRDHARRLVLENVLGSQLTRLRGRQAITYGFSASYDPRRGGGLWTIGGEADASRAAEAAGSLMTILAEMRTDPESYRAAFVLGRQKALERLLVGATSSGVIAERLALLARFDLPDDFYDDLAANVAALTLADFHKFLVRELDPRGQVVGAFGSNDAVHTALAAAKAAAKPAAATPAASPGATTPVDPF